MTESSSTGMEPRLASLLSYSVWWMSGLVFLLVEREHRGVRFHAAQSLVAFGTLTATLLGLGAASVLALVIAPPAYRLVQVVSNLIWLGAAALWLALMVRTWRGDTWRLPLVARLADRLV